MLWGNDDSPTSTHCEHSRAYAMLTRGVRMGLVIGFVFDLITDWLWVGFMLRLKETHRFWYWALISAQLAIVVAIVGLILGLVR